MSSNYNTLARKRSSMESLLRQGRRMVEQENVSLESAESYSALVDVVVDQPLRAVADGTKTPDEILEEAYQRLEASHQDVEKAIEVQTDVDDVMGDNVSLSSEPVVDQIIGLDQATDSLEALRNAARVIYHSPALRKSRVTVESLQRYAAHCLRDMDIPRKSYASILKKGASLESIHSTLNKLSGAANDLICRVGDKVQSVSAESLLSLDNVDHAVKIQRVQKILGKRAEKRGAK